MFIISLVVAVGIPTFITIVIHPQYRELIVHNAESDAVQLASHLMSDLIKEKTPLNRTSFGENHHLKIETYKNDFDLYKIKVFSAAGEIIFSTDPKDVGEVNDKDYFHNIVGKNNTYTKVVRKDQKSLEDQIVNIDVVECYVPIMVAGTFSGAFEIYFDATAKFRDIGRLYFKTIVWVLSFSVLIVVFVLWSLWHAGKHLQNRERAEQALKESEEKFRSISASINDALITIDRKSNITFWNDAAEKIFGHSKKEVLGRALHPLLVPKRAMNVCKQVFNKFAVTGTGRTMGKTLEMSALRKDGTEFPVELSLSSYQLNGRWYAVGTIRDISHRKSAERERENLVSELQKTLRQIKKLSGLLPICAGCKKVRNDQGYWNKIETYIQQHSEARFSHGICPDCAKKLYPDLDIYDD